MRLAIDANRYSDLARGDAAVVRMIERAEEVCIPFVVLGELRAGFALGAHAAENHRRLARFLSKPGVSVLWADEGTTHVYADVFASLRRAGRPIPTSDLCIAALCIQHGLPLYTRDRHFEWVDRLARI